MPDPRTVRDALAEAFPWSSVTALREMVRFGRALINGQPAKSFKQPLGPADVLTVGSPRRRAVVLSEGLNIVDEDKDIVVIEKPPGLLTSTDATEMRPTVLAILARYFENRPGKRSAMLVHRLDRDASGLLVFALHQQALARLKKQFFFHTVDRQYDAVVHGVVEPSTGELEDFVLEDPRGRMRVSRAGAGKPARLEYRVERTSGRLTLVRCKLFTGRKHQIRVQWFSRNHPVLGDPVYGTPAAVKGDEPPFRLALHAAYLAFDHPVSGKRLVYESPHPAAFDHLFGSPRRGGGKKPAP